MQISCGDYVCLVTLNIHKYTHANIEHHHNDNVYRKMNSLPFKVLLIGGSIQENIWLNSLGNIYREARDLNVTPLLHLFKYPLII